MEPFKFYVALSFVTVFAFVTGCNKEVNYSEGLYPLLPASIDANAGTWAPVAVTSYTKYSSSVPTPADTSAASYKTELAGIKNLQSVLTSDQQNAIAYWSDG